MATVNPLLMINNPRRQFNLLEANIQNIMVEIPRNNISLMELDDEDFSILDVISPYEAKKQIDASKTKTTVINDIYVEEKPNVDGEELPKKYYKILGVVYKIKDIEVNSYLVKEIFPNGKGGWTEDEPSPRTRFSLTRSDCKFLGIDYREGIEVYPFPSNKELFHKLEEESTEQIEGKLLIDENDLSTYPVSRVDGTIRKILIKLNGFGAYNKTGIIDPKGRFISMGTFVRSLNVRLNRTIPSMDNYTAAFVNGAFMRYRIVAKDKENLEFNIVDGNGNIYIEVNTSIKVNKNDKRFIDGAVGISPKVLKNVSVKDLFRVDLSIGSARNVSASIDREREILSGLSMLSHRMMHNA
jgi:hypothetical protein